MHVNSHHLVLGALRDRHLLAVADRLGLAVRPAHLPLLARTQNHQESATFCRQATQVTGKVQFPSRATTQRAGSHHPSPRQPDRRIAAVGGSAQASLKSAFLTDFPTYYLLTYYSGA
ncbi:hypothetical protein [Cupriavidus basilensis]|uniref:hypothetical protein n=1 Tax=Cupriavidus basilensis TaxID=68895 RepID=UPI0039F6A938